MAVVTVLGIAVIVFIGMGGITPDLSIDDGPEETNIVDFSTTPITIAVENRANTDRDFTAVVESALDYWRNNSEHGAYTADFQLRPNASDPDMIIWYNKSISCESTRAIGCAPLLNNSHRIETPAHVEIGYNKSSNFRMDRNTVIHEIGHVLGIEHCTEPLWVMGHANYCSGDVQAPTIEQRAIPWRNNNLTVYLESAKASNRFSGDTPVEIAHAIEYFNRGADGHVPNKLSLQEVDSRYHADIVIAPGSPCEPDVIVCPRHSPQDPDGDGNPEYYTSGTVRITTDEVDIQAWAAGFGLAKFLTPTDIPEIFIDPSREEMTSDWWRD
jgi:hypothetical protein